MPRNAGLRKVSSDLWCQIRQFCKAKAVSQMVSEKERLWPRACDVSCRRCVMLGYGWTPESDREVRCDEMIYIYNKNDVTSVTFRNFLSAFWG
jgi:hypothetical protein